ncbi:hypothetical protein GCM10010313_29670 [Streptomyces violarus]|uniref:Uncharacterized protein n=1 Tax=Streptomyces violarus TaxID=67380 RepID=A0A7W5F0N4_9ACTN|nr:MULTISPECIES: hypothetical protein [Streptomyces]MBB3075691.1 hypothetical protein [Streptomyces violarus]WRT98547.1 hypothetical protein VJ737_12990 [Streptomyces sp. CGMCC 4.1772]GHD09155.1 hypothetical protein GCM10010313_29670 [Streptomyces violarus]
MTIVDVLTGFAESGGIGILKPGASLADVSERLGPPQDGEYFPSRRRKKDEPRNLRYGDVRLEVCCDILRAVALSTGSGSVDVPSGVPGEAEAMPSAVTAAQLREAFSTEGIRAEEGTWPEPAEQVTLVVRHSPADVHFTFRQTGPDESGGGGAVLHSAIARDTHHVCR